MFKRNEGVVDRIVRVTLGLVLLPVALFLLGGLQGSPLGLVAASFGGWVLVTGIIGFCPIYIPLGINTLEKEKDLIAKFKSMAASCRSGDDLSVGRMCFPDTQSLRNPQNQQEETAQGQT